jgi:hypothetical protein
MLSEDDIKKLDVSIKEVCSGWFTIDITYNGKVIKTIDK